MKVHNRNHVYECVPPFLDNRTITSDKKETEQVILGLKVANLEEQDAYRAELFRLDQDFATDKAAELKKETTQKLLASKFAFVKNLEIEGVELDEKGSMPFETFYREAPPEIVSWMTNAVMRTTILSESERKNF